MTGSAEKDAGEFRLRYSAPPPFGELVAASDGEVLTGLSFCGFRGVAAGKENGGMRELPPFRETIRWLDAYFAGRDPGFRPAFRLPGATPFRLAVLREVLAIPFGRTATYGEIARAVARRLGVPRMSARAVGGAVGWNPVCLVVPCHRVVAAGGAPGGYGGGLANKLALLRLESRPSNPPR